MVNLPATVNAEKARLPETYAAARHALAECQKVDECKDWADKAQALASYAKQANDDELYGMARRIQGRAVRRMGELLEEFKARGARSDLQPSGSNPTKSQRNAAKAAGLSKDQEVTARRVAAVPVQDFEAAMESGVPPTISKLAEAGRKVATRPKPEGFAEATAFLGQLSRLHEFCEASTPALVVSGLDKRERAAIQKQLVAVLEWCGDFLSQLPQDA